jgi:hypothetical protein
VNESQARLTVHKRQNKWQKSLGANCEKDKSRLGEHKFVKVAASCNCWDKFFVPLDSPSLKKVSLLRNHFRLGGHFCRDNGGQNAVRQKKIVFFEFFKMIFLSSI